MPFVNLNRRIDRQKQIHRPKGNKKWLKKTFIIILLLVVLFYLPARGIFESLKSMSNAGKGVSEGLKRENLGDIQKSLKEMKSASNGLNMSLNFLIWLRIVPFVGGYYADAKHFAVASGHELDAALRVVDIIEPDKVALGFTGQPNGGEDRIAQFVKILDKVLPQIGKLEPDLKKAKDEVSSIDVSKYPEKIGKYNARDLVDSGKNLIMGAHTAVTENKQALEIAPNALGEPTPKNYLIIFQNDKELRATGGFMTAYAFLRIDKGKVTASVSDDIYRLDEKLLNICKSKICPLSPPAPIVKYLPEANGKPRTAWSMRDSNLSPDLPTSLGQFERMFSLFGEGLPFDGIITIDTHVVEDLIGITGPVEVYGTKYSADIDKRCNCPNVIYELENYAQIIEKGEKDRKAILGVLMQQVLAKSLTASPDKMPEFINALVKLAGAKHLMFYMHDGKHQQALAQLNWTGQVKSSGNDYLMVNDSNFAGGKSNIYVEEGVTLDINTTSGKVKNKLTIEYKNPQPFNTWLNGINRDYVRVYVPKGSKLIASKGSDVQVTTIDEELGKTVFEAFIQIRPQNSRTLSFEYELPIEFKGKDYPILIQKQPGTKDFEYTLRINGKQREKFRLDSDKELKLGL